MGRISWQKAEGWEAWDVWMNCLEFTESGMQMSSAGVCEITSWGRRPYLIRMALKVRQECFIPRGIGDTVKGFYIREKNDQTFTKSPYRIHSRDQITDLKCT